ncbi:trehalase [Suricata suricatta]|uniref:trehalase n=1 Tax=Suricata suricatta TaxID=37032 RepID=UPI0011565114|nr:trehalase [Suricata suricatta]
MPGRAFVLCQLLLLGLGCQGTLPPPCDSQIYCHGELLHQVQMAKLFQDDKQFVDMPLSTTPDQVLQHFRELAASHNDSIPRPLLHAFVQEHFRGVGQELEPWTPADWKDSPRFLQKIADPKLRVWGEQLHQLWKKLGKKPGLRPGVLPLLTVACAQHYLLDTFSPLRLRDLSGFAQGCPASVLPAGPQGWHPLAAPGPPPAPQHPQEQSPYDISNGGQPGGGGEYEVQEGFGWTNGVVLMLLDRYGDRLSSGTQPASLAPHALPLALPLALLPSLLPQ